jgi:hypothetical protein
MEINLTSQEESLIYAAAKRTGLSPQDWIKQLALESLTDSVPHTDEEIDVKLRQWQKETGSPLMPESSARELFAQWDEEDARMTDEEREAEDRLWEDIEQGLVENRGLHLRLLDK